VNNRPILGAGGIGKVRLRSQGVTQGAAGCAGATPLSVVTKLGALQGQDYFGALWSIGLRVDGSTEREVEASFERREIVRTWPMRGTLHVIPAADARWMLGLLAPRVLAATATRRANLGLDDALLDRAASLFTAALSGGNRLTRSAMLGVLENAGIETTGQRGYHILFNLSMRQLIVFGPREGKEQTFVLFDEWLPDAANMSADAALALLTSRYFAGHGPATIKDFAGWCGLTLTDARRGLAMADDLVSLDVGGVEYWMLYAAAAASIEDAAEPEVSLLPGFDEFVLGYKDRSAVLDPEFSELIVPGNNGVFRPTVVIDGRIVGTWKRVSKKGRTLVETSPFTTFTRAQHRAIDEVAERYLRFTAGRTGADPA